MKRVQFVGLDVHADTIAVAVAEPGGTVRSLGVIPNRPESIRKLVKRLGAEKEPVCGRSSREPGSVVRVWALPGHPPAEGRRWIGSRHSPILSSSPRTWLAAVRIASRGHPGLSRIIPVKTFGPSGFSVGRGAAPEHGRAADGTPGRHLQMRVAGGRQ